MFYAHFLFTISIMKYIVNNVVKKINVGIFCFLICPFLNWLQAQLEKEREELELQKKLAELELQNKEAEMQLQQEDEEV